MPKATVAQPCKLAMTAAANAQASGISPILITILQAVISAVLPQLSSLLTGCLPAPTPAKTREFIASKYVARKQRYAPGVLHHAMRAVEDQSSAQGASMDDADVMTTAVATLDAIRLGTDADIQEAMDASA